MAYTVGDYSALIGETETTCVLRNVVVDTRDWLIFDGDVAYLPPTQHILESAPGRPNADRLAPGDELDIPPLVAAPIALQDAFLVGGIPNYYHFLTEYFSRLYFCPQELTVLVDGRARFQHEILSAFGFYNRARTVYTPQLFHFRELHISMPCFSPLGEVTVPKCCGWFRQMARPKTWMPRQVYISRRLAAQRHIKNEEQLEHMLAQKGFQTIIAEKLSVAEQMSIFASAELIVAPHGAGLANMIFATPGAHLIELMPSRTWSPDFMQNIAAGVGAGYTRVYGDGGFSDPSFTIEVDAVAAALAALGSYNLESAVA